MIYTGYFSKTKMYEDLGLQVVSIAGKSPDFFKGPKYPSLAPDYKMFMDWKKGKIDDFEYTTIFKKKLATLDVEAVKRFLNSFNKDVILLCYEKPGDFCHRHIVADWLEEVIGGRIDEYDQTVKDTEKAIEEYLKNNSETKEILDILFSTDTTKVLTQLEENPPEGFFLFKENKKYSLEDKQQFLSEYGVNA